MDQVAKAQRETRDGPVGGGRLYIDCSYQVLVAGLTRFLESEWDVDSGTDSDGTDSPSCIVCCADGIEGLPEKVKRLRESFPDVPIVVFGVHLDLPLAHVALQAGARGFIHAGMKANQVRRAVTLAADGEVAAPRKLLEYLVDAEEPEDADLLSARQREILRLVAEGLSNGEIAKRCFLSESTVKQHLRVAFKLLNVSNRIEAAALVRNGNI